MKQSNRMNVGAKIVIAMILICTLIVGVSLLASNADENVIEVRTIEDLYAVRNNLSGSYKLMNDIDLTDDVAPGGDWDNGYGWSPIGESSNVPFTGTFDGNGYTINGLSIRDSSGKDVGLFGCITGGTVKNLKLTNVSITSKDYTGAVAGKALTGAVINNIKVEATITSSGGRCGGIIGDAEDATISQCYFTGTITCSGETGGIAGYAIRTNVSQCFSVGTINYTGTNYVGGIIGNSVNSSSQQYYTDYSINNCYSTVTISSSDVNAKIGGIAGRLYGTSYSYKIQGQNRYNTVAHGQRIACCVFTGTLAVNEDAVAGALCGEFGTATTSNGTYCTSVSNAYYAAASSSVGVYGQTDSATTCIRLTPAQVKLQSCYGALDFETVWFIDINSGVEHPQLRAIPESVTASIDVFSIPKTLFEQYLDEFSTEGGVLLVTYSNGHETFVDITPDMVTGFDNATLGEQILTITYGDFTATYTVIVYHDDFKDDFPDPNKDGAINISDVTYLLDYLSHNCSHQLAIDEAVEPTCTETGLTEGKHCSICGQVFVAQQILPALGHQFTSTPASDATCTEDGVTAGYFCQNCGFVLSAPQVIPAKGHTPVTIPGVEPTCAEPGLTEGTKCSVCQEILTAQEVIPATGQHSYVELEAVEPTCTEPGLSTGFACSVCGQIAIPQETVAALGHDFGEWTIIQSPTCVETGVETRSCSRCSAVETRDVPATGEHVYTTLEAVAPTCTETGLTAGTVCSVCGQIGLAQETVAALGHDFGEWTISQAPTCAETGVETRSCSRCSAVETRDVPATGEHVYTTLEFVAPTCTETGLTAGTVCSVCGYVLTQQEVVPATGHTLATEAGVEPTCTEAGATEKQYCAVCGVVIRDHEVIPATGHSYVALPAVAPTCTEPGLTAGMYCEICNTVFVAQDEVAALGHDYVNGVCSRCGKINPALNKGDVIKFGSYEQDNDLTNGKEDIEWIVLDVVDGKALLLSKYILEHRQYNTTAEAVTWETCTLRTFLNGEFYDTAFDSTEKSYVLTTVLQNNNNSYYGTNGGNITSDKVFLLSLDDIINTDYGFQSNYSTYDAARQCQPTAYVIANNIAVSYKYNSTNGTCWWWLRSPGGSSSYASIVGVGGYVCGIGNAPLNDTGLSVNNGGDGVRPAIWIEI